MFLGLVLGLGLGLLGGGHYLLGGLVGLIGGLVLLGRLAFVNLDFL